MSGTVLDKGSGGVVAQLKVLSEVNSCDNLQLLIFQSQEKDSLVPKTKEEVRKWSMEPCQKPKANS